MKHALRLTVATALAAASLPLIGLQAAATTGDPVVFTGRAIHNDGSPATGADARLLALPPGNPAAVPGDSVKVLPVSTATTDASGRFTLTLAASAELQQYISADHFLDLDVVTRDGDQLGVYSFTLTVDSDSRRSDAPQIALARDPSRSVDANVTIALSTTVAPETVTTEDSGPSAAAIETKGCGSTYMYSYYPMVLVGSLYSTWTGFAGYDEYQSTASSTLGVGMSSTGAYGTYGTSGTRTKSSTQTFHWPASGKTYKYYKTEWIYDKDQIDCYEGTLDGPLHWSYVEVNPRLADGGGTMYSFSGAPTASHCVTQNGFTWTTQTQTALNWTNGVSLAPIIGISLSSKSNWTTHNKIGITTASKRTLCGTHDVPGGAFGELVAKP